MALTHYGTLGVLRCATHAEIREAFRDLASVHHPDRGGDTAVMAELTRAYAMLSRSSERERYDAWLEMVGTPCVACGGAGARFKQKGFSSRIPIPCKTCNGEGVTAVASKEIPRAMRRTK
jgi:DnaJ-class molecular chaperone